MRAVLANAFYGIVGLILNIIIFILFVSGLLFALVGAYGGGLVHVMFSALVFSLSVLLFLSRVSQGVEEGRPGEHAYVIAVVRD